MTLDMQSHAKSIEYRTKPEPRQRSALGRLLTVKKGCKRLSATLPLFALRPLHAANLIGVNPIFSLLKRFIKFIKMAQLQERLSP
ncbi:hypothetical protein HX795_21430 [Pseudomonas edaphica]|uniref:Uncharacterized protein n=1 Tax=Pseudomonas edaphica TaxID=2006980 RepID=A0A7Y8FT76_9PSED|nr:hypothetical protein [Pseudomonas edaphica]